MAVQRNVGDPVNATGVLQSDGSFNYQGDTIQRFRIPDPDTGGWFSIADFGKKLRAGVPVRLEGSIIKFYAPTRTYSVKGYTTVVPANTTAQTATTAQRPAEPPPPTVQTVQAAGEFFF